MKKYFLIFPALLLLCGCAWFQEVETSIDPFAQNIPSKVALAKSGLEPFITAETAYASLPLCSKVAAGTLCKDINIVHKLKAARLVAHDDLDLAEQAANSAVTAADQLKAQDLMGAADSAISAFKQLVQIFSPSPVVTPTTTTTKTTS